MKPSDVIREIFYPLKNIAIVFAMLFFWMLFGLVQRAGLIGLWLLIIIAPAYIRYLLYLLEARANNRAPPVPEISMFNPVDNLWSLTPLILISMLIWVEILFADSDLVWLGILLGMAIFLIVPATLAILAVTHSPSESLNPSAILRMIRVCGAGYFLVPAVIILVSVLFILFEFLGMPPFFTNLGQSYQIILLFTLTGAVLHANDVAVQVDIDPPLEKSDAEISGDLEKERQKVANHAYGFINRNNRAGGLAHINQWIDKEADTDAAYAWFFREMLTWENSTAALFFAQVYMNWLLHGEQEVAALKLAARCLHEDPRWKPQLEDRALFLQVAEQHGREDLIRQVKS
ncbi:MAG: hypothetical protein DRR11_05380 [Gammaproteobacteria bacterium]|nr:MAG: hypothetical protein DRR11_05380 [Gammaproteobacteria bacterium]RLA33923.1 MAG: hypothetical protein DRR15_09615 [Gammaproteobacteria bacterium]